MSFESSKLEGEIAEQMFIDYLNFHGKKFFDARNDKECRLFDIDIITLKDNHNEKEVIKDITNGNSNKRKKRIEEVGCAIEVKLDKVIHNRYINKKGELINGTNNFVYEVISHNMPGWAARCCADHILYVCVDTFDDVMTLSEVYLIDLYKLRENLGSLIEEKKAFVKELKYVKEQGVFVEENILNILININAMKQKEGVCQVVTDKFIDFFPKNLYITEKKNENLFGYLK